MKIKSRALACFIAIESRLDPEVQPDGFVFPSVDNAVGGKKFWEWERDFNASAFSVFNQRLRTLGDAQRDLRNY